VGASLYGPRRAASIQRMVMMGTKRQVTRNNVSSSDGSVTRGSMAEAKRPVAILCDECKNRIFAARKGRMRQRLGTNSGIVRVTGGKDDIAHVACLAVATHGRRYSGYLVCSPIRALAVDHRREA